MAERLAANDDLGRRAVQQEDVGMVGVEPPKAGFDAGAQKALREILRQGNVSYFRHEVPPGAALTDERGDQALDRLCCAHPGREILPRLGHDDALLAPAVERG